MTSPNLPETLLDQVPPAARADEAEATLLGCCLNWATPCLAEAEAIVGPDDFFDPARQRLFAFLLSLGEDTRDAFDLATLERALKQEGALEAVGGRDELIRLADMAATREAAGLHAKAVREAAVTRRLRDFCLNTLRDTGRADFKPADVLGTIEGRIARLARGNGHASAVTVCLADVEPEPVRWLWPERIALGKPTILVGDPGVGKSFITLDLAARVSTGAAWPDGAPGGEPGGVVILSAEDGLADTIRPRLDAAGADVQRIVALQAVQVPGENGGGSRQEWVNLRADLDALAEAIQGVKDCRLVVIDPVSAYLGDADSYKNSEIRAILAPLARLATDHDVAILAVSHLRKSGGPAMYRTMGSLAFNAAARAVWAVAKAKDDPTGRRRLLLPVKNNLAEDGTGMAYELGPGLDGGTVVQWEPDPVHLSADDALAFDGDGDDQSSAVAEAVDWLSALLADGPLGAKAVKEQAEQDGIKSRTLDRAKVRLGIKPRREGFGEGSQWVWGLPAKSAKIPEERQPSGLAHFGNFGAQRGDGADSTEPAILKLPPENPKNVLDKQQSMRYNEEQMATILDEIRAAIRDSDKTCYRIAKDTGISESQLSLFMNGKRRLSVETLERLAAYLGLEVTLRPKKKGG